MKKDKPQEQIAPTSKFDRFFPKFVKPEVEPPPLSDDVIKFFCGGISVGEDPPGR